jgi:hypothetical protein
MYIKRFVLGVFLVLSILVLTACHTDGEAWVTLKYVQEGTEVLGVMEIVDDSSRNGIYLDYENQQLYCQETGTLMTLPKQIIQKSADSPEIEIEVETICSMGQEAFDAMLEPFDFVAEE